MRANGKAAEQRKRRVVRRREEQKQIEGRGEERK